MTLNKDVACQKHRDGNDGHSWMLWLGDYAQGGELHFEDGAVIKDKRVWHKFQGQVPHWNTPHEGGTKYSVILYRSTKQSKHELLQGYKKRKKDVAAAAATLEGDVGILQGMVGGEGPAESAAFRPRGSPSHASGSGHIRLKRYVQLARFGAAPITIVAARVQPPNVLVLVEHVIPR